jgi:hypothetical protein
MIVLEKIHNTQIRGCFGEPNGGSGRRTIGNIVEVVRRNTVRGPDRGEHGRMTWRYIGIHLVYPGRGTGEIVGNKEG